MDAARLAHAIVARAAFALYVASGADGSLIGCDPTMTDREIGVVSHAEKPAVRSQFGIGKRRT
jgi:hypothetical protein